MSSIVLQATAKILVPIQLFLSLFFFLRGHNEPGGGFIAALIAVGALTLHLMAFGRENTKKLLRVDPLVFMALGWVSALASGISSFYLDVPFMTSIWGASIYLPFFGKIKIGTVLFFDLGVYLLVAGGLMKIIFLADEER